MVEDKISVLQNEINTLIEEGSSLLDVYELSLELDRLILQYYDKTEQKETSFGCNTSGQAGAY